MTLTRAVAALAADPPPAARLTGAARREQILQAATPVVAVDGFAATTETIARAAGVSQPYVIRVFGGKRALMLAVVERAGARVLQRFEAVPAGPDARRRLTAAARGLLADRDLLRVLLHGVLAGGDEQGARVARRTLAGVRRRYVELTGDDGDGARAFVSESVLLWVLAAANAPEHRGEDHEVDAMVDRLVTRPETGG